MELMFYFLLNLILIFLSPAQEMSAEIRTIDGFSSVDLYTDGINCINSTFINIHNVLISKDEYIYDCNEQSCRLNEDDLSNVRQICNGKQSCFINSNFTTTCLYRRKYVNISYTCKAPPNLRCSFETHEKCSWTFRDTIPIGTKKYEVMTGVDGNGVRPYFDHTTGKGFGRYVIVQSGTIGGFANIVSSPLASCRSQCLSFWFSVHGDYTITVKYKTLSGNTSNTVRSLSGVYNSGWTKANFEIDILGSYIIIIEGFLSRRNETYIAIDDIDVMDGPCDETKSFKTVDTFEYGYGNWTPENSTSITWSLNCFDDRTTGYFQGGSCSYASTKRLGDIKESVRLKRLLNSKFDNVCLKFWYRASPKESNLEIDIYLMLNGENYNIKNWVLKIEDNQKWKELSLNINATSPYVIVIEVKFLEGLYNVGIDDILLQSGQCPEIQHYTDNCVDINKPTTLQKCPSLYLTDDVKIDLRENNNPTTLCPDAEHKIYQICHNSTNFNCTFNLTEMESSCFDIKRNVTINYTCINESILSTNEVTTNILHTNVDENDKTSTTIGLALGITGGIVLLLIIVAIIYIKRRQRNTKSKSPDILMGTSHNCSEIRKTNKKASQNDGTYDETDDAQTRDGDSKNRTKIGTSDIAKHRRSIPNKADEVSYNRSTNDTYDSTSNSQRITHENDINVYDHTLDGVYDTANRTKHAIQDQDASVYGRAVDDMYDTSTNTRRNDIDDTNVYGINVAADDVYDTSNNVRLPDVDDVNVYGHNVDGVYDSATHYKRQVLDQTYDHLPQ